MGNKDIWERLFSRFRLRASRRKSRKPPLRLQLSLVLQVLLVGAFFIFGFPWPEPEPEPVVHEAVVSPAPAPIRIYDKGGVVLYEGGSSLESQYRRAPHVVDYVFSRLREDYGEERLAEGGFEVATTISLSLQNYIQQVLLEAELMSGDDVPDSAVLVANSRGGEVLGMVGSANYYDGEQGKKNSAIMLRQISLTEDDRIESSLWYLVQAYGVLANGGRVSPLHVINKVSGGEEKEGELEDVVAVKVLESLYFMLSETGGRVDTGVVTYSADGGGGEIVVSYSPQLIVGVWSERRDGQSRAFEILQKVVSKVLSEGGDI